MKNLSKNIIGQKIGKLTVISENGIRHGKKIFYCKCDCGNYTNVIGTRLRMIKGTKSCGCLKKSHFIDLTGQKFNKLTLVKYIGQNNQKCFIYEAKCDCGNFIRAEGNDIKSNRIKSCGCLKTIKAMKKCLENPYLMMIKNTYSDYRIKARQRNYNFDITLEYFSEKIKEKCYYCNSEPKNIKKPSKRRKWKENQVVLAYNGLDRVDNTKGYTVENTVSCCSMCNIAKSKTDVNVFYQWVNDVYINLKNKGLI
jgi:hypothetical protein